MLSLRLVSLGNSVPLLVLVLLSRIDSLADAMDDSIVLSKSESTPS